MSETDIIKISSSEPMTLGINKSSLRKKFESVFEKWEECFYDGFGSSGRERLLDELMDSIE